MMGFKLKQMPLDNWSTREQLCLASSVVRSGDQNWVSVSRAIKPYGEANRPADWFSQKNCALQYSDLLEKVETPKRKRGERAEIETPGECIVRKLTLERIEELKRLLTQERERYRQLKDELHRVNSGHADDELETIWEDILEEKRKQSESVVAHQTWLQEREAARQAAALAIRKGKLTPVPKKQTQALPTLQDPAPLHQNISDLSSEAVDSPVAVECVAEEAPASESTHHSPLLNNLLRSTPPTPTTTQAAAADAAVVVTSASKETTTTTSSPTIASLLSAPSISTASSVVNLFTTALGGTDGSESKPLPVTSPSQGAPTLLKLLDMPLGAPGKLPPLPVFTTTTAAAVAADDDDTAAIEVVVTTAAEMLPLETVVVDVDTSVVDEPREEILDQDAAQVEEEATVAAVLVEESRGEEGEVVVVVEQEEEVVEEEETETKVEFLLEEESAGRDETVESAVCGEPESSPDDLVVTAEQVSQEQPLAATEEVEPPPPSPSPASPVQAEQEEPSPPPSPRVVETTVESVAEHTEEDGDGPDEIDAFTDDEDDDVDDTITVTTFVSAGGGETCATDVPEDDLGEEVVAEDTAPEAVQEEVSEPVTTASPSPAAPPEEEHVDERPISPDDLPLIPRRHKVGRTKRSYDGRSREARARSTRGQREVSRSMRQCRRRMESAAPTRTRRRRNRFPRKREEVEGEDEETPSLFPADDEGPKSSQSLDSLPNSPSSTSFCSDDPESVRDYKLWKKSIMLVWRAAANHKYANVFLHAVTEEMAPGYRSVVYRPMDLITIKKNIESGAIRTTAEFQRDVMLMFQNAIMYNNSDHDVYQMAINMQKEVMPHIQDYLATQLMVQSSAAPKTLRRETREHKRSGAGTDDDKAREDVGGKRKRMGSEGGSDTAPAKKRRARLDD